MDVVVDEVETDHEENKKNYGEDGESTAAGIAEKEEKREKCSSVDDETEELVLV